MYKKVTLFCLFGFLTSPLLCHAESESTLFDHPFYGLGLWFGGDTVAINPGGDDYDAGSGAVMSIGFSNKLIESVGLISRNSIAYRYQGARIGKGENSGVILETEILKEWKLFGMGVGLHADFMNQVLDAEANKTTFNNSFGPTVFAEWIMGRRLKFVLKYLFVDFETDQGIIYSGDQYGFSLQVRM